MGGSGICWTPPAPITATFTNHHLRASAPTSAVGTRRAPDSPGGPTLASRPVNALVEIAGHLFRQGAQLLSVSWPTSGAREDDKLLGRPGHRGIAVDRSFDTLAGRLWVDEDDQIELEPLGQFPGQRPDAGTGARTPPRERALPLVKGQRGRYARRAACQSPLRSGQRWLGRMP
jgi:hypothetical protein